MRDSATTRRDIGNQTPRSMKKASNSNELLATARILHQAGLLTDTARICRQALATDRNNVEALILLAEALQRSEDPQAEAAKLWKRALALKPPPWLYLRSLTGLLQSLIAQQARAEATRIARQALPEWPVARVPDAAEREMILSLARMLVDLGQLGNAASLLDSALVTLHADGGLLHALGEIQILQGDMPTARRTLEAADRALQDRPNLRLLADLHRCARSEGDRQAVLALRERGAAIRPVYAAPAKPGQGLEILVFNSMQFDNLASDRKLHFNGNYPAQILQVLDEEFHFSSIFAEFPGSRAAVTKLPKPDLIINNLANGEQLLADGTLEAVSAFADSFKVPVINHPSQVVHTTRDRSAELIADVPGVIVPKTRRFLKEDKDRETLAAEIEDVFAYPLITRTTFSQEGMGMTRIDSHKALLDVLQDGVPREFLVTEFVDSRGTAQFYRKIRIAIIGDEMIVFRADYDTDWNVHGRTSETRVRFYRDHPEFMAAEDRICRDPERELGLPAMQALRAMREHIPLEIFGIDFDIAPDGRVVFYEANATMNLLPATLSDVASPRHAKERVIAAFRRYLSGRRS